MIRDIDGICWRDSIRPVAQWQERGPYMPVVVSSILTGTI